LLAREFLRDHQERFAAFVERGKPIEAEFNRKIEEMTFASPERYRAEIEREEALAPLADEQAAFDEELLDTWAALVPEEQAEQWQAFRQQVTRWRWLARGSRFAEESIDLIAIVESLELEAAAIVDGPVFEQALRNYGDAMDAAVLERRKHLVWFSRNMRRHQAERMMIKADGSMYMGDYPSDEARKRDQERQHDRLQSHERVLAINRQYRDSLANLIAPARRPDFTEAWQDRLFAKVWSEGGTSFNKPGSALLQKFESERDSLEEHQRIQLDMIHSWHQTARRPLLEHLVEMHDLRSGSGHVPLQPLERQKLEADYHAAYDALSKHENALADRLWAILTPEQKATWERPPAARMRDPETGMLIEVESD